MITKPEAFSRLFLFMIRESWSESSSGGSWGVVSSGSVGVLFSLGAVVAGAVVAGAVDAAGASSFFLQPVMPQSSARTQRMQMNFFI